MLFILDEIPCDLDNPCQNAGTCSGTKLNYQCSCAEGYTGTNCESVYPFKLIKIKNSACECTDTCSVMH